MSTGYVKTFGSLVHYLCRRLSLAMVGPHFVRSLTHRSGAICVRVDLDGVVCFM